MRVFVTGANGFVGRHLITKLLNEEIEVIAAVRNPESLSDLTGKNLHIATLDLMDKNSLISTIKSFSPNVVFHLAAQSNIPRSWNDPLTTMRVNVDGTLMLVEAVASASPKSTIFTIGTGEEYGLTAKHKKCLTEIDPCQPQNPYAISKFAIGQLGIQLASRYDINIIHLRPFNHFGPYQSDNFVVSDFSHQIAKIENNLIDPVIKVGNIDVKRDFTDVRDIISAYYELITNCPPTGIYNICSGSSISVSDLLQKLISFTTHKITVIVEQDKLRKNDIVEYFGSNKKLTDTISWKPKYNIETSLEETLDWWRQKIKD